MCRPGTRTGSRRLAAPAPPLRSTQGVCSDPSEWRGWVFIREHVRRRTNTDPIAPFLEPSWELWTEGHWLPVAPSNREPLHCLSVLRVCVWYLNDGNLLPSWTRDVWAESERTLWTSKSASGPPGKVMLSGKPLDPPFIHAIREETRWFIDAPLWYIVSSGPECLSMGWVAGGGTEQWKLYACQLCFTKQVMGLNFISIIYSMWGSSWTHGIGTLKRFLSKRDVH